MSALPVNPETPLDAAANADAPPVVTTEVAADAATEASAEPTIEVSETLSSAGEGDATKAAAAAIPDLPPAVCAARLAELFPALFAPPAKPIKLRIHADIQQRAPGIFNKRTLSIFLHRHTTSTAYLRALATAPQRLDLDGNPAGDIADEHRSAAAAEVERRKEIVQARRADERALQQERRREEQRAAHIERQREAKAAQRREEARDDAARRERGALVRAYEASTLTRANFCALKGITEADLDAQLLQAKQDAAQQPAMPPRAEWRGDRRPNGPTPDTKTGPRPAHSQRELGRDGRGPHRPQRSRNEAGG